MTHYLTYHEKAKNETVKSNRLKDEYHTLSSQNIDSNKNGNTPNVSTVTVRLNAQKKKRTTTGRVGLFVQTHNWQYHSPGGGSRNGGVKHSK